MEGKIRQVTNLINKTKTSHTFPKCHPVAERYRYEEQTWRAVGEDGRHTEMKLLQDLLRSFVIVFTNPVLLCACLRERESDCRVFGLLLSPASHAHRVACPMEQYHRGEFLTPPKG